MRFAVLLAHQGGWDEILMVAGPVMVFAFLLSVARKRALALAEPEDAPAEGTAEEAPAAAAESAEEAPAED